MQLCALRQVPRMYMPSKQTERLRHVESGVISAKYETLGVQADMAVRTFFSHLVFSHGLYDSALRRPHGSGPLSQISRCSNPSHRHPAGSQMRRAPRYFRQLAAVGCNLGAGTLPRQPPGDPDRSFHRASRAKLLPHACVLQSPGQDWLGSARLRRSPWIHHTAYTAPPSSRHLPSLAGATKSQTCTSAHAPGYKKKFESRAWCLSGRGGTMVARRLSQAAFEFFLA